MPHIDWTTTRTALAAALALPGLPVSAAAREVGSAALAELDAVGANYEAAWTRYGATLATREAAYATALTAWTTELATLWADASRVVSTMEGIIYAARAGLTLKPRVLATPLGSMALTQHTDELPSPWADPVPAVTASLTLNASGAVPVLRVEAKDQGIAGNACTVTVTDATTERAERCKITVTRGPASGPYPGPYVEVYDEVDLATSRAKAPDTGDSLLVNSFTIVGTGRPLNLAATHLTGGAGNVLDAMLTRLERLVLAARAGGLAMSAMGIRDAEALTSRVSGHWSSLPDYINPLAEFDARLQASVGRAAEQTAIMVAAYP